MPDHGGGAPHTASGARGAAPAGTGSPVVADGPDAERPRRAATAHGGRLLERMVSTPGAVRTALRRFCAGAPGLGLSAEGCMAFEIVLAEALNNIVEHSYREQPSGWIVAEVERVGDWVVCRLTDGGRAMPGETLPPARPDPDARAAALPEGGFGWQLIRDLAHHVTYAREGGVNRLLFALPVDGGPTPPPEADA